MVVAVASVVSSEGVAAGLVLGVCGVVERLVGPWGWAGEFHTSQCSAFQSGGRARGGRQGRCRLGRLVRFGIGVVGGALGAADRWVVCVLGHRDSIRSRVAIG